MKLKILLQTIYRMLQILFDSFIIQLMCIVYLNICVLKIHSRNKKVWNKELVKMCYENKGNICVI